MKNIKKLSIILLIAFLPGIFSTSCTDSIDGDDKNTADNYSDNTVDSNDSMNDLNSHANQPAKEPAVSTLIYEGDFSGAFSNPERGYYKRSEITERDDFAYIADLGITVVHSYIPIYKYYGLDADNPWSDGIYEGLPGSLTENLQRGLDAIRRAGLKAILRPAYAWDWRPPVAENWDIVKSHIAQINEIISKNADVVMALEAGILGLWGEWHGDGIFTDSNSEKGAGFRYELFKYILDTTPDSIPVRLRYPYFIKEMLYLGVNPPEGQSAMTQAQSDRIGYHNDSFMVDENDWGSYNPREVWWGRKSGLASNHITNNVFRQWMYEIRTSSGGNILMGGETEWAGDTTVKHENSIPPLRVLEEMANLHTTDISTDYNPEHINLWRDTNVPASETGEPAESVYDRIGRRLGYRLRLTEAEMTAAEFAGGRFEIDAAINNDGFAGIINARPAYIVLDDGKNRYDIMLSDIDARLWLPGLNNLKASFKLPEDIAEGAYKVALWLPDAAENLRGRAEYSVRFANKNVWDSQNGYNVLGKLEVIAKQ